MDHHHSRIMKLPYKIRKYAFIQEQWMILSRDHAKIIILNNKNYRKLFIKRSQIPDEMYYITMLYILEPDIVNQLEFSINNREKYKKHDIVTFANWYDDNNNLVNSYHPKNFNIISEKEYKLLVNSNALFARKFIRSSDIKNYWKSIIEKDSTDSSNNLKTSLE